MYISLSIKWNLLFFNGQIYLIAPEIRYVACNQSVTGSKGSFVFWPLRQKSRVMDSIQADNT